MEEIRSSYSTVMPSFAWKIGTQVHYPYRSATGHGIIIGIKVKKPAATTHDDLEYAIQESDHHVSASGHKEPDIVFHYGRILRRD